jgi:cellulose synthase/poly-beta-1,6-N-acetylglucosamine synthase-like glycosyltransferase
MTVTRALFWISAGCLLYVYLGYPLLVWAWARRRPRPIARAPIEPTVTIALVAHNEESRIAARLANLLALDYPRTRLEILVGSDGSTDRTVERARAFDSPGLRVVECAERRGKAAVLNELLARARGSIVVLTDARQAFEPSTLREIVACFADPDVGAVSGELVLAEREEDGAAGGGAGFYWRYEKFIRRAESRVHSTIGATGAVYAIRRELFEPFPSGTVLDDVLCPLRIVRRGYRVVFASRARAYDRVPATAGAEFVRKVRTIAGTMQLLRAHRWILSPRANRLWFQTMSHKVLRLFGPLFLAALLVTSFALAEQPPYGLALAAQVVFYAAALAGFALRGSRRRRPLLAVPFTFVMMNWAVLAALGRILRGRPLATWTKAAIGPVGYADRGARSRRSA